MSKWGWTGKAATRLIGAKNTRTSLRVLQGAAVGGISGAFSDDRQGIQKGIVRGAIIGAGAGMAERRWGRDLRAANSALRKNIAGKYKGFKGFAAGVGINARFFADDAKEYFKKGFNAA